LWTRVGKIIRRRYLRVICPLFEEGESWRQSILGLGTGLEARVARLERLLNQVLVLVQDLKADEKRESPGEPDRSQPDESYESEVTSDLDRSVAA
jgi:hypothetical protein